MRQVKFSLQWITQNPPCTPPPQNREQTPHIDISFWFNPVQTNRPFIFSTTKVTSPGSEATPILTARSLFSADREQLGEAITSHAHTLIHNLDMRLIYCEWQADLLPCVYIMITSEFMATHLLWWKIHKPLPFTNTNTNVSLSLRKLRVILRLY